jgi:hypothetical protein
MNRRKAQHIVDRVSIGTSGHGGSKFQVQGSKKKAVSSTLNLELLTETQYRPIDRELARLAPRSRFRESLPSNFFEQLVPSFQCFFVLSDGPASFGIPALEPIVLLGAAKVQVLE